MDGQRWEKKGNVYIHMCQGGLRGTRRSAWCPVLVPYRLMAIRIAIVRLIWACFI